MLLELKAIRKSYAGKMVLNGLELSLEKNEARCIMGPNGAGKSTLLKIIYGDEHCDSGRIYLSGTDVTFGKIWERAIKGLGISFQTPIFPEALRILDLLELADRNRSEKGPFTFRKPLSKDSADILALFKEDFWPSLDVYSIIHELNHADRKKLDILIGVLSAKKLCLLDEPSAGLGKKDVEILPDLLKRLKPVCSFLVIEHNLSFLAALGEKISFLHRGQILYTGSFKELSTYRLVKETYLGNYGEDTKS